MYLISVWHFSCLDVDRGDRNLFFGCCFSQPSIEGSVAGWLWNCSLLPAGMNVLWYLPVLPFWTLVVCLCKGVCISNDLSGVVCMNVDISICL